VATLSGVGKRLLVGRKLRSSQMGETLLPKRIAVEEAGIATPLRAVASPDREVTDPILDYGRDGWRESPREW